MMSLTVYIGKVSKKKWKVFPEFLGRKYFPEKNSFRGVYKIQSNIYDEVFSENS